MKRGARSAIAIALALGATALPLRADTQEDFDAVAVECALAAHGDPEPGRPAHEHFIMAAGWSECLVGAVAEAEAEIDRRLEFTIDKEERRALKQRRKLLRQLAVAAADTDIRGTLAADPTPDFILSLQSRKLSQLILRSTTDLRFLALESFRTVWQQVLAAVEARRDELAGRIADALAELDAWEGAGQTESGQAAEDLATVAVVLIAELQDIRDALDVPLTALPGFGEPEDRAARRTRKRFKGLGNEYGETLGVLARLTKKVEKKVAAAIEEAIRNPPCVITDPHFPGNGGGQLWVTVDGVGQIWDGRTSVSLPGTKRAIVWIGSLQRQRPNILFELYGRKTTRPGTYEVRKRPTSDDFLQRDYAVGAYKTGDGPSFRFHHLISGTLTIEKLKTGSGKRLITGSFDVVAEDDDGHRTAIDGVFHLCDFEVERPGGAID